MVGGVVTEPMAGALLALGVAPRETLPASTSSNALCARGGCAGERVSALAGHVLSSECRNGKRTLVARHSPAQRPCGVLGGRAGRRRLRTYACVTRRRTLHTLQRAGCKTCLPACMRACLRLRSTCKPARSRLRSPSVAVASAASAACLYSFAHPAISPLQHGTRESAPPKRRSLHSSPPPAETLCARRPALLPGRGSAEHKGGDDGYAHLLYMGAPWPMAPSRTPARAHATAVSAQQPAALSAQLPRRGAEQSTGRAPHLWWPWYRRACAPPAAAEFRPPHARGQGPLSRQSKEPRGPPRRCTG